MVPDIHSWGFVFLIYLILGWNVTRYVERSAGKDWHFMAFVICMLLWVPLLLIGFWSSLFGKK